MIDPAKVREAYAGIQADEGIELGEVLSDLVEQEGERLLVVAHSADEFEKITLRICELMEIVRQNALVSVAEVHDAEAEQREGDVDGD